MVQLVNQLKGYFFVNPFLALSLAITIFSFAGIPPLVGFFGKQMVLYTAIQSGYYFMSIVAIVVSVISASYYLKIIKVLHSPALSAPVSKSVQASPLQTQSTSASSPVGFEGESVSADPASSSVGKEEIVSSTGTVGISNYHSFLISIITLSILLFFIKPSLLDII